MTILAPNRTITRLSLCLIPTLLLACVEDPADPPDLADELEQELRAAAGQQATLLTLTDPDAVCNDGSAAVVKVKLDPNGGNNWLVYLQGGGSCKTVAECEERWSDCQPGTQYPGDPIGSKQNMTANTDPMNFDGRGILDFDGQGNETSPFAGKGFNRVFIPYCSSDQWRGLGNTQSVNFAPTCGDPNSLTTINFNGGKIVEAVIDEIMASQQAPESGDFIVLAGGSAGGQGVQQNLDRVATQVAAAQSGVVVAGVADASFRIGLDQDGIPVGASLDAELFWAGLNPATVIRTAGDPIDVVVDDSCWTTEVGGAKDYCHDSSYAVANYLDRPLMMTTNSYDETVYDAYFDFYYAGISDCGGANSNTYGADPDLDALYFAYCDPVVVDPTDDIKTWMRYQIAGEGAAILDTVPNTAYYIAHSSVGLHDKLLKDSDYFYRRASTPAPLNALGGYEFAGLGTWTSPYGSNADPSVATTVACALGMIGVPGAPSCDPLDVRVTSTLPTQVSVIENALN